MARKPRIRAVVAPPARGLVLLFVLWHLSFLLITNASLDGPAVEEFMGRVGLGVGAKGSRALVDSVEAYESYLVMDQAWGMFSSPLWRSMPFPAGRLTLSDGAEVDLLSVNEPQDMTAFFRIGGARLRKLEHYFVTHDLTGTYQESMQRRYAATYATRWREMNPGDGRTVTSVTILRRDFAAPRPGKRWEPSPKPVVSVVVKYAME